MSPDKFHPSEANPLIRADWHRSMDLAFRESHFAEISSEIGLTFPGRTIAPVYAQSQSGEARSVDQLQSADSPIAQTVA